MVIVVTILFTCVNTRFKPIFRQWQVGMFMKWLTDFDYGWVDFLDLKSAVTQLAEPQQVLEIRTEKNTYNASLLSFEDI